MKILTFIVLISTLFFMTACSHKKDMKNVYYKEHGYRNTNPILYDYVPLTPLRKIKDIKPLK